MKQVCVFLFCLLTFSACAKNKDAYTVKGKIGNYNAPAVIYLQYLGDNDVVSQSTVLKDGAFSFTGVLKEPANARLVLLPTGETINNQQRYEQTLSLILVPETIEVNSTDVLQNAVVSGSLVNEEHQELNRSLQQAHSELSRFMAEAQNVSPEQMADAQYIDSIQTQYLILTKQADELLINFAKTHPQSFVSLMIIANLMENPESQKRASGLFNDLSAELKTTKTGKEIASYLEATTYIAIGSPAPDFTQNDVNGKAVSLSDFKGKYVLIDFWASWCGPCRKENPHLVQAYHRYKDKNFEILGVSLDQGDRAAWMRAIERDQLTWPQVSDLRGWQNAVAKQYNITQIPQNLLLDPDGIIIAKNLRGSDLEIKLSEIFKN